MTNGLQIAMEQEKTESTKHDCMLPCDNYGFATPWCFSTHIRLKERANDYMDCNKPDWDTCYPIENPFFDDEENDD